MKDWKFIKTGNAGYGSTEDIKSHLDTDLYDIYQKLNDKNAPSFEYVRQLQKKGWDISTISKHNKFIGQVIEKLKTGNEAVGPNWDKKRQLEDELRGWMTSAKKLTGEEKANAEKQIAEIRKELNDVKIKIAHGENKKACNSLTHDYHNKYPKDPIYADIKSSATLEAVKKEPWRVYDIIGVGDSIARERIFEMIEEKYKIDYNDIYEAWLGHSWDKAVQKKSMDEAKRLAQKLGIKLGNESINKQTWSMFKGLSKDAEKEVGNENADDKFNAFIKKYGYPKSKEEAEWLYKQAKHEGIDESYLNGMKRGIQTWKVGNEFATEPKTISIGDDVETLKGKKGNVVDKNGHILKIKLSDGSFEYENEYQAKKVGNARPKEQLLADVRELTKYIKDHPGQDCEKEKRLLGQAKEELDKNYGVIVGNKQIAGDFYDILMSGSHFYIYKNGGTQIIGPFNSEQEAQKKIDAIAKERSRTGNETLGQWVKAKPRVINDESTRMRNEYNAEIQRLTKKAEELRRMGQGRSAMEVEKQIEKLGKELREIGNKKVGNVILGTLETFKALPSWTRDEVFKNLASKSSATVYYYGDKYLYYKDTLKNQYAKEIEEKEKEYKEREKITGNETKGERKFGKVMGEFERGELKSGSGEKVTDPAQAKAIAYSEADKVDNLKRARNAMAKNAMGIADLEAQIKKNKEFIRQQKMRMAGKAKEEQADIQEAIDEAQDEIDRMTGRIYDLNGVGNKKVCNLDHVEEGDYVSVRINGEIKDGVVRKVQGTDALVTVDGVDQWISIRRLKEST